MTGAADAGAQAVTPDPRSGAQSAAQSTAQSTAQPARPAAIQAAGVMLASVHWHRVAFLRPKLRPQVAVQRQLHRGQVWHQLVDGATGRRHRLNRSAWRFIGRFDGQTTVGAAWEALLQDDRDLAITQEEAIRLLEQLSSAELLSCELPPDIAALFQGKDRRARRAGWQERNPFAIRVRLFDPDRQLARFDRFLAPLFSRWSALLWLLLVLPALPLAARLWPEIKAYAAAHADAPRMLLIAWCLYPLIKALHEAGHALAVRRWGGAVHDVGMTLFVLVPVPYVDASAASGFARRGQRAVVSAIGILVELAIAAVALFAWNAVENGLVRETAFMAMAIAGLSTIVFNANPLLRFDGYHLLCDVVDVPNLDSRSRGWWASFVRRRLFGETLAPLALAPGEMKWLFFYAPLAWSFRLLLALQTMFWGAAKSALLGAALGAVFVGLLLLGPLRLLGGAIGRAAGPNEHPRMRLAAFATVGVALLGLFALPVPYGAAARAVIWLPEQAQARAGTDGFVRSVLVADGQPVQAGQALALLEDPTLTAAHIEAQSRLDALRSQQYGALRASRSQALGLEQAINHARDEVARLDEKVAQLTIRAATAGQLVLSRQEDLPGTFLRQGSLLGHVVAPGPASVRAIVSPGDAALVQERTREISVRLDDAPETAHRALRARDVPAASNTLPSAALADRNGGNQLTDPADAEHLRTLAPFFQVDLTLPTLESARFGGRAWTYFDFGPEPLALQWAHSLRQVLMQHFGAGA